MRNKIHFMGIGAAKCGTTWLSDCLREHPQISISEPKEVNYFNNFAPSADKYLFKNTENRNPNFSKPLAWYFVTTQVRAASF